MIKANVPSRIAFAVSSQTDSRVILDTAGAEALLGSGDMLYRPLGTSRLQRVQGAFISEEEIALIVEQCRSQAEPEFDEELLADAPDVETEELDPDEDSLLDEAILCVAQHETASVSLLQRRLRVGYTRAGRLIDMLERRGVITGYEGSKPRRVLDHLRRGAAHGLWFVHRRHYHRPAAVGPVSADLAAPGVRRAGAGPTIASRRSGSTRSTFETLVAPACSPRAIHPRSPQRRGP